MADPVAMFAALTGNNNEDIAIQYLSAADFNAETAAQLYIASEGGASGGSNNAPPQVEDTYIPPPPEQTGPTTLVDGGGYYGGGGGRDDWAYVPPHQQQTKKVEKKPDSAIGVLFSSPDYKFRGTPAEACKRGQLEEKYVVLNVLKTDEFISGAVNRDIWRNPVIQGQMEAYFIFCQEESGTNEGQMIMNSYKITMQDLPYTVVLDPLTKSILFEVPAKKYIKDSSEGPVVHAEWFSEKLIDFLDRRGPFKMPKMAPIETTTSAGPTTTFEARGSTANATSSTTNNLGGNGGSSEEDDLAKALAMSEQQANKEEEKPAAAAAPAVEVDLTTFEACTEEGALKCRVRLPSGAWDIVISPSMSIQLLAQGILCKLEKGDVAQPENLNNVLELRGGFPPKPLSTDLSDASRTVKDTQLRNNDTIIANLK